MLSTSDSLITADAALASVIEVLGRLVTDSPWRSHTALSVVVALANSRDSSGTAVFAGDCTATIAYDSEGNYVGGADLSVAEGEKRRVLYGPMIFGVAPDDVFSIMRRAALSKPLATSLAVADVRNIEEAMGRVATARHVLLDRFVFTDDPRSNVHLADHRDVAANSVLSRVVPESLSVFLA